MNVEEKIRNSAFFAGRDINPDYQAVKRFLTVRPYPVDAPGVAASIHKTVGDIALVLYAVLWEDGHRTMGTKVPAGMEKVWGVPQDTLLYDALSKVEPRMIDMDSFLLDIKVLDSWTGSGSFCLTTEKNLNGAVAIFKPGVAELIEGEIGPFWLAFTSIQEVMIHPVEEVDAETLRVVMRETIENCVQEDEVLTHQLYRYEKGAFRIWVE